MSTFSISSILNQLLEQNGLNESTLGRAIGIPRATINRLTSGRTPNPRATTLQTIAEYFDITVEQLLGHQPLFENDRNILQTTRQPLIPILNWDDAVDWKKNTLDLHLAKHDRWAIADNDIKSNIFALEIAGEAMWPQFRENSILIIDPDKTPKNRDFVVYFLHKENKSFFRQLFIDNEYKFLKPINNIFPTFQITQNDICIGVIIQVRSNFL